MEDSIRFADQSKALWLQHNKSNISDCKKSNISKKDNKKSFCFGICPFASIIATLITLCGTGIFCGCLYRALSITINTLKTSFKIEFEIEYIKIIQTIIVIVSTVMCTLSIILLIVGFLATGVTRSQIYTGFKSRLGGRISTSFFVIIVYMLFIFWSIVTVMLVLPIICYLILIKQCSYKKDHMNQPNDNKADECLSLKSYGIELNHNKNSICSEELIEFCNQGKEAGPLFIAAFLSSSLIVLGLIHYLCCLIANYAYIKDGIKLKDYEEAIREELELRCELASSNRKKVDL